MDAINEQIKLLMEQKVLLKREQREQTKYLEDNEFVDMKDYEGLYKINKTEIWSCWYKKVMVFQENDDGYLQINLTKNGKSNYKRFHRLLAIQYIPNPENLPEIDHIDRNKKNNNLENLRWCDRTTNANNKSTNIAILTEEKKTERITDLKEYQRKWAEDNRRANGVEPKAVGFDATAYSREYQKKRRAEMTPEEKEAHLEHRKAIRPIQTEEQKEKARARAKKQRDDKKAV